MSKTAQPDHKGGHRISYAQLNAKEVLRPIRYKTRIVCAILAPVVMLAAISLAKGGQISFLPNGSLFGNPFGASQTISTNGKGIDMTGPFFQSLGSNGRSCATCHQPSDGMAVSAANVQARFAATRGT